MDLFVVPTVSFRLLYGLLIMGHGRRQILWLGVTANPTAEWIANQLTQTYGWEQAPHYLIRDLIPATAACLPGAYDRLGFAITRHRHAHRGRMAMRSALIGSIRRECLDHVVVFGERHLRPTSSIVPTSFCGKTWRMPSPWSCQ